MVSTSLSRPVDRYTYSAAYSLRNRCLSFIELQVPQPFHSSPTTCLRHGSPAFRTVNAQCPSLYPRNEPIGGLLPRVTPRRMRSRLHCSKSLLMCQLSRSTERMPVSFDFVAADSSTLRWHPPIPTSQIPSAYCAGFMMPCHCAGHAVSLPVAH